MDDAQHVVWKALTIRCGGDIGIELVEGRNLFANGAVLFVFTVIVVIEDGDQPGTVVKFPEWASGGFYPEFGEVIDYEPA